VREEQTTGFFSEYGVRSEQQNDKRQTQAKARDYIRIQPGSQM